MDKQISELQKERTQLFENIYQYRIPKRLPVDGIRLYTYIIAQYAGINAVDAQFDMKLLKDAISDIAQKLHTDTMPVANSNTRAVRNPSGCQLLGSKAIVMSNTGSMQHPEVSSMQEDEYKDLIADPYAFIREKAIPRIYSSYDLSDPVRVMETYALAEMATAEDTADFSSITKALVEEKGYYAGAPRGSSGYTAAPCDFLADLLRGFTGISKDIRRRKNEVKDACDILLPVMFQQGLPSVKNLLGSVRYTLHMPTFMRQSDMEEIWLPTFKKMLEQYAARGLRVNLFCEDNWTRYLDILQDLPAGMEYQFEYGDPKQIKNKLGDKFIIKGLFPIELVRSGEKTEMLDYAKDFFDTMLPGGGYLFEFDKIPMALGDLNMDNLISLTEYIAKNTTYDTPGIQKNIQINMENYQKEELTYTSKYFFQWNKFQEKYPLTPDWAKTRFEKYAARMQSYFLGLLF